MIGGHCIKTWSVTQGAYALSSAEAEFYAMIEAVLRAKGLRNLAVEVGFTDLENIVHIGTDSRAAKSFVGRDLWLQKEVNEGKVVVHKVLGTENPSDLGTKILNAAEITERLEGMKQRPSGINRQAGAHTQLTLTTNREVEMAADGGL